MRKIVLLALVAIIGACGEHAPKDSSDLTPPEESRFVQEIFATNLYEPTELVVLPKGDKVLFTQRRGQILEYDLKADELRLFDSLQVFSTFEHGLMGIALDPEFAQNNWLYLYYSPAGDEPVQYLSRFTYTSSGLKNEKVVLEVPVQRETCCHTGGSIEFGPDGLLYLSTGDDTNPFASNGFSPSDERPGRKSWDAQRTSSNTNDLRGKILRIKPEPNGSYSIPKGNLFEDNDPLTRPEIYVMGCRNPYRIGIDSKRGWLFWGDVGPDARNDKEGRGPRGHDEWNVARSPGYYGWPLFVGKNYAYNRYDFESGKSFAKHDPTKPINQSVNNTGLKELPPARPATIYYPYAKTDIFPQVGSGGRNAMAGPVYYSDQYQGRQKFPKFFDGRVPFFDWMRGFVYFLELDEEGQPTDWYPFMPNTKFNNLIDMEFAPDGTLFLLEYGTGWFSRNENAKLSRVRYVAGNRPPVLQASASVTKGTSPLTVVFDASASYDYDGHSLAFNWDFEGEILTDSIVTYTFEEDGIYYPELVIADPKGGKRHQQFVIEVGNEPPVVAIEIEGNESFFWPGRSVNYEVKVSDLEDEQNGSIDESKIAFEISHFQSSDRAEALGHQVPVAGGLELINSLDCMGCHKIDGPSIGPSYQEVAERYQNDRNAVNYLAHKIINGGGGVWGEQAMSAHPDLSNEDAQSIVNYILSLAKPKGDPLAGSYVTAKEDGRYLFSASYEDGGKGTLKPILERKNIWLMPFSLPGDEFDDSHDIQARGGRINSIYHGSWVSYRSVDLTGIKALNLKLNRARPAIVEVRSGSADGKLLGKNEILEGENPKELAVDLQDAIGFHDVFVVFKKSGVKDQLIRVNRVEFVPETNQ